MYRCSNPNCFTAHIPRRGYCNSCHAAYMREWRKTHPLTGEARRKMIARSYANVYQRLGVLKKQPCQVCGSLKSEKHHADYSRPLSVQWLCRAHHLALHHRPSRIRKAA